MKKGSRKRIREEGREKVIFAGVVMLVLLVAFVGVVLVITNKHTMGDNDMQNFGTIIDAAVEESRLAMDLNAAANGVNYEMLRRNGGNLHTYDVLCRSVTEYFEAVFTRDYDTAYSLYACGVVEAAGYSYSYDDYVKDMESLLEQIGLTEEKVSGTVHVSYYTEYDNYYTVRLVIQRKNFKNGYVTYDNTINRTCTLVPDAVGDLKVLDFDFHDFRLYSHRFDNIKATEDENVYEGVIVIPE